MSLNLFDELRTLLSRLDEHEIEYALVGALALAMHGAPRATTDIDLLIRPEAVDRAADLAKECGFLFEAAPMRFSDGMRVHRLTKIEAREPNETLTLDLIVVDSNLEPIWESRQELVSAFGPMWVISRDALIRMKTWAGRERDIADIRRLEELDR